MLRGLDSRGTAAAEDSTIIKVADRAPLDAEMTVYVDGNASDDAAERQANVAAEFERLEAAGVLQTVSIVAWQDVDAGVCYEEFREAVGVADLAPFFEELADGNAIDVPHVCVAIRDDDELTGLYPRLNRGTEQTVEDCFRALASGDRVENV